MHCPFCAAEDTKVIDSRLVAEGDQVRRRRECLSCAERFTTYESAELVMPRVIKQNGSREPFDENKLRAGLLRALEKRPVSVEDIDRLNIHRASLAAMREAVMQLLPAADYVLADGFVIPDLEIPQQGLPKGDRRCACIAAASIVAPLRARA